MGGISLLSSFCVCCNMRTHVGKGPITPSGSQGSMSSNLKVNQHRLTNLENEEESKPHAEKNGEEF